MQNNKKVTLWTIMAGLLLVVVTGSALADENSIDVANKGLESYYNSNAFALGRGVSNFVPFLNADMDYSSTLYPDATVPMRHIRIISDSGKRDVINIFNYNGGSEYPLAFYLGQGLTHVDYEKEAIYLAEVWHLNIYIIERRESEVVAGDDINATMRLWDMNTTIRDYAIGNAFVSIDVGRIYGIDPSQVKLYVFSHSLGGIAASVLEASDYDEGLSASYYNIIADASMGFDPKDTEKIQRQKEAYVYVQQQIDSGVYADTGMSALRELAQAANDHPDDECILQPLSPLKLSNIQVFRVLAGETHLGMPYPYNDEYCYCAMEPIKGIDFMGNYNVPLKYVDENEFIRMTINGGTSLGSPNYLERDMSGYMANLLKVDESKFDGKKCTFIGFGGGIGPDGEPFFKKMGADIIRWKYNEKPGHASILLDRDAPELWDKIGKIVNPNNNANMGRRALASWAPVSQAVSV